jgi:selenocysteine lyase/cysteine desulfurase
MLEPSWSRRAVIGAAAAVPVGATVARAATPSVAIRDLSFAEAEQRLARDWDVDRSIANFDAAYYGAIPRVVHRDYLAHTEWVNRNNSLFLRSALPDLRRDDVLNRSRSEVAKLIGASMEEVALCTGGTEALYALITNYRPLKAGDAVIIADVDYDEMQYAMAYLEESRGARLIRMSIPEPSTDANILAAYDRVLRDTPRAKLLLLTHLSNRNGLVPPVKEIIALAKARGVDVVLDSAQAVGHLPFTVDEIGADFVSFSIHNGWPPRSVPAASTFARVGRMRLLLTWETASATRMTRGHASLRAPSTMPRISLSEP